MSSGPQQDVAAIVVAAGRSQRAGGVDKLWALLADRAGRRRALLAYTLEPFQACPEVRRIALVVAADAQERARDLVRAEGLDKVCAVVAGGEERQDSVRAGLAALEVCAWVVVHDGARPLVNQDLIERGLEEAQETGAACCAVPVPDTVKEADQSGRIIRTVDRSRLYLAQTPQVFRYDLLREAHERVEGTFTDDAARVEAVGGAVRLYEGSSRNFKVTTSDDLALVEALLAGRS